MPVPEHVSVAIHVQRVYTRFVKEGGTMGKAAQSLFDEACGVVEAYMRSQKAAAVTFPPENPKPEEVPPPTHAPVVRKRDMWSGGVPKFAQQPPPGGYRAEGPPTMTDVDWLISVGFKCGTDENDWCYPSWENPALQVITTKVPGEFLVVRTINMRALSRDELGRLLGWCKPATA